MPRSGTGWKGSERRDRGAGKSVTGGTVHHVATGREKMWEEQKLETGRVGNVRAGGMKYRW